MEDTVLMAFVNVLLVLLEKSVKKIFVLMIVLAMENVKMENVNVQTLILE